MVLICFPTASDAFERRRTAGADVDDRVARAGQLAIVFDKKNKFLAVGLYDPQSPLRVRVVHTGKSTPVNADFWRNKV